MLTTTLHLYNDVQVTVPHNQRIRVTVFSRKVAENRADAVAHRALARVLKSAEHNVAAATEYSMAGQLFSRKSQYSEAYRCFKSSIQLNDDLNTKIHFAYLCKTLGFKNEATQLFQQVATTYNQKKDYSAEDRYLEEALRLHPVNVDLLMQKASSMFQLQHPIDLAERAKNSAALLLPLTKTLNGTQLADLHYKLGFFLKEIDCLFAVKHFLMSIWSALDVVDIKTAQRALNEVKILEANNASIKVIEDFLKYLIFVEGNEPFDKTYANKICREILKICDLPLARKHMVSLLESSDKKKLKVAKQKYLIRLPKEHPDKKMVFLINSDAERGNPKNKIISEVINYLDLNVKGTTIRSISSHLSRSYFRAYFFRYRIEIAGNFRDIGQSDHLLFLAMFNMKPFEFQRMLKICGEPLLSIRDSSKNTLVHVAACFGLHQELKVILAKAVITGELKELINSRNEDGTNPLGMLFLRTDLPPATFDNTAEVFIKEPAYNVNSYLNNNKGMDYRTDGFIKQIGGLTCLHVALEKGLQRVIDLLHERNMGLYVGGKSDHFVNMSFPSLHPERHMYSPEKFIPENKTYTSSFKGFLSKIQKEIKALDEEDSSGDSSDEDSPAFFHKKSLQDLAKIVTERYFWEEDNLSDEDLVRLNTDLDEQDLRLEDRKNLELQRERVAIVHFHGVPFMQGHYTNDQRRFVGKKVQQMNQASIETKDEKKKYLERLKGIHSRTSTSTVGFQTLYDLMNGSEEEQEKLEDVDEKLRVEMAHLWINKPKAFMEALGQYIYNFSSNPIEPFWRYFPTNNLPDTDIVRYRFPFGSFSKAPDHAVKFGVGENVETQSRGEKRIEPSYDDSGQPSHRLVGLLYVTFHSFGEIQQLQNRCVLADTLQLRSSDQLESKRIRTDNQLEVLFFGGVSGKHVKVIIPIIYPNLNKPFKPGYHDVIWGLNEENLKKVVVENGIKKKKWTLDQLKHAYINFALKLVRALARRNGQAICYINEQNTMQNFSTVPKTDNLSPAQREISDGNVVKRGSNLETLKKTTPEQLSRPQLAKQQSSSEKVGQDIEQRARVVKKSLNLDLADDKDK